MQLLRPLIWSAYPGPPLGTVGTQESARHCPQGTQDCSAPGPARQASPTHAAGSFSFSLKGMVLVAACRECCWKDAGDQMSGTWLLPSTPHGAAPWAAAGTQIRCWFTAIAIPGEQPQGTGCPGHLSAILGCSWCRGPHTPPLVPLIDEATVVTHAIPLRAVNKGSTLT